MPYKSQHSARLVDPRQFDSFASAKDRGGQGVSFIFGMKKGSSFIQAVRFDAKLFTVEKAKAWLKENNFKPILFEAARESMRKNPLVEKQYRKTLVKMLEDEQQGKEDYKKLLLLLPVNVEANKVRRIISEIIADEERHEKLLLRLIYF